MPAESKHINLLPPDPFEQSVIGKFLKWALSVGRYIVIGTELVVIGSFLTRFSLDRQVTDLNEAIAQKQAIIASYGDLEQRVRQLQAQLKVVGDLDEQLLNTEPIMNSIAGFTPLDVIYSDVNIQPDLVKLTGTAFSEAGFRTLLTRLRLQPEVRRIAVENMSSGSLGSGIEFTVTTYGY